MVLSAGALALLAGIAASAAATGGIASSISKNTVNNKTEKEIKRIQEQYGITRSDAEYLAEQYKGTPWNLFDTSTWGTRHTYNTEAEQQDYQDYLDWMTSVGDMPQSVDIDGILQEASNAIASENKQISDLYDQISTRNINAYNDYANQVISNQIQSQNMLQGSVRSELARAQRNAISKGATAAQRLVSNINTQLGLQNKAAQQSLETSNVLAQQLINTRQADTQNLQNRANLIKGTSERVTNYANSRLDQANSIYNQKLSDWEDKLNSYAGTNPYADVYRNQQIKNKTGNSTYGI